MFAQHDGLIVKHFLCSAWGDKDIVLSTANTHSYLKVTKTLREYVSSHTAPQRLDRRLCSQGQPAPKLAAVRH